MSSPNAWDNPSQKHLEVLTVEMVVLLLKMPSAQRFNDPVDPKVLSSPLHGHNRFDSSGCDHLARFSFESDASFVLTQVAQSLAAPQQRLQG